MHENCLICDRINLIKQGQNPYFIKELETGYVVLGDHQFYEGYTLFLCKVHARELHELDPQFRQKFLEEMSRVAQAVFTAFQPNKLNYELLGNTDHHMHWHIFPRRLTDPEPGKTIWSIDKNIRCAEQARPSHEILQKLRSQLLSAFSNSYE